MTYGELFLYMTAGAFWGVIIHVNSRNLWRRIKAKRATRRLDKMVARIKEEADAAIRSAKLDVKSDDGRETHTLKWRHKGEMHEVKIIIDPALDHIDSEEEFDELVKRGDAGHLKDLLEGNAPEGAKRMAEQDAFVFSRRSVENMKMAGLSPDEIVTKILKASGRMD